MSRTVFIVDDDKDLLEGMEGILEAHNFDPVGFSQAKTFWRKLKKMKPDAVVLDIGLNGENGDVIAKKLKSSPKFRDVPVVLISAAQDLSEKALRVHADSYLAKPFSLSQFVETLDGFVSSRIE